MLQLILLLLSSGDMNGCHKHLGPGHDVDPAMASCCQRDLAEQAQASKILRKLQTADPSVVRTNFSSAVLGDPSHSDQQQVSDILSEDEAGHAPDPVGRKLLGHDISTSLENLLCIAELQHLRDMRLRQLRQESQQKLNLESQGHGSITESTLTDCEVLPLLSAFQMELSELSS